ncbi:hypothetical protein Fmac_004587 [Flemingia macrophylla]|uniref:BZIP domain-containing protein n=1 Tax=Flemingia macrophylla TaxID=520843 RepID=A0ABD1N5B8_9FABA
MGSPGGASSSGSSSVESEERKRKRMVSNRESARRSRIRKQQQLESLSEELEGLKKEREEMSRNVNVTMQMLVNVESENAVLMAQVAELSNRFNSLTDIIHFINSTNYLMSDETQFNDCGFLEEACNANSLPTFNQPIIANADVFMY